MTPSTGILTDMRTALTAGSGRLPIHLLAVDNMRNAGPGWYYDPDDQSIYRYWDGYGWTEHRSDTVRSEVPS